MFGRKVKLRILFISLAFITLILTIFLILKSLEENVVYFQSPSEIRETTELSKKKIRIGGMVKKNSISMNTNQVNFIITDFKNEINVSYMGVLPNLFEEEKGVVAEGYLKDRNFFSATKILAKHDENYMPPEVKEALKEK
ncbi:cytochrome c maturation protein CcmE [Candidatus Pelagibacter sp.]|jgi:cytochrome c-type biogenesis protein CcmE|uniref:cytochrome c maturation protein CcmE n=1 Tax=Candidatus Pelagibacter sp. TaxID=2024849 RepID=UPI000E399D74|nr:MAG: cytochrome c maturation protein CcmE [Pseudomonadota bacterium]|tara:strand:- start:428 stop:847 length:420 start_codon:yes stop_codon:yes gene_type:complete